MSDQQPAGYVPFSGARRVQQYREGQAPAPDFDAPGAVDTAERGVPVVNLALVAPVAESEEGTDAAAEETGAVETPPTAPPAQWGWRGRWNRASGGRLHLAARMDELAHRDAVAIIRQATFPRAVNVVTLNPKGGAGKTTTTLLLADVLADVRGGYVCAVESTDSTGSLARRAEGTPAAGLAQLVANAANVTTAGQLSAYTAPQTSHADVIGSTQLRGELTARDVLTVRGVLDTHYRITVTDTGNNPSHDAFRTALYSADAAVIPCLVSLDAVAGVEEALCVMRQTGSWVGRTGGLVDRVVVVLGHDGGPEDPAVEAAVRERLARLDAEVVEVPYDRAIRRGGELTLSALSQASRLAWTNAAAAVVRALLTAPPTDLVHALRVAMRTPDTQG